MAIRAPFPGQAEAAPEEEIILEVVRDGVIEEHTFTARARASWGDLIGVMRGQASGVRGSGNVDPQLLIHIDRIIRRALVDDDGTPLRWTPNIVEGHFTDPNGDHTPADMLPQYTAFEAGSSRRRWVHLMDSDDDVEVHAEQIARIFEGLMALTGKDRGRRSSSSSPPPPPTTSEPTSAANS